MSNGRAVFRRVRRVLLLAGLALAALPAAPALAGTTVGQTGGADFSCSSGSPGAVWADSAYVVPSAGTINSFSFQSTSLNAGQKLDFLVLRPVGGNNFTVVGKTGLVTLAGTGTETFAANVPVQGGEILAWWLHGPLAHCGRRGSDGVRLWGGADPSVGQTFSLTGGFNFLDLNLSAYLVTDSTAPNISITRPAENEVFKLNQSVLADYSCSDDESTVTKCEGPVANGAALDTTTVGPKSFKVDSESEGGATSKTHNYSVVWDTSEFGSPINGKDADGNLVSNAMKAGGAVPVKFSLNGNQGLDIFAADYPKSEDIDCDSSAEVDGVEETLTTGNSGLHYDEASDQYTYVWKTDKAWAGTCRQLVLKLADGTSHRANFKFAK